MNIQCWNKLFQDVLNKMPKGYWLFVANGKLHLMKLNKNGKRNIDHNYSMSQRSIVRTFDCPNQIDGGDW